MIWLTWRQQRTETMIAVLLFVAVAAVLVPTGLSMASAFDRAGIAGCLVDPAAGCADTVAAFGGRWQPLASRLSWFNLAPALIGALITAPLVLDFEHGTFRLAWTQSATPRRWLTTRLALIAAAALVAGLLLTLLMTWWREPLDAVDGRMPDGFEFEGLAPSAFTLYAAALVIATGVVMRRAAAAVALSLGAYLATRIAVEVLARPHYHAAVHDTWSGTRPPDLRGAWVLSETGGFRTEAGQSADPAIVASCAHAVAKDVDAGCLTGHGITPFAEAVYHPANRFWLFQAVEAGIFVALALMLVGFSVWWIRRRIA